jgi:class 3 adenylate cyclase
VSLRAQLLWAILAVVAVTTVATLLIAQRQSSLSYRALVDELFRQQTAAFQQEQERRLNAATQEAERLALSVRLFAALEVNDPGVYLIAADELRLDDVSFFRLFNAAGQMIVPPPDVQAGALDLRALRGALLPPALPQPEAGSAQVGFVEGVDEAGGSVPYRVLAAPIVNFGERVGTLVLGQRLRDARGHERDGSERQLYAAISTGGRLLGSGIPTRLREPLSTSLQDVVQRGTAASTRGDGSSFRYAVLLLNPGSAYPPAWLVSVFSLEAFETQQRELAVRIAATGFAALLFAAAVAFVLSRGLARPVGALVAATRRIRHGDYAVALPPSSTRELSQLAEAFNEMAAGLALSARYRSILAQATDPEVAEEMIAGRIKLGGELREVTIVFCDIRGYTELAAGRKPEEVIAILNAHLGALTHVVHAHRGVINQFAGDAIMILFGAPKSYGADALRAVRCAMAMMQERARLNAGAQDPLQIGIGIATGAVVAGCIGAETRSDYTAVGERTNLAARLCSAAAPGDILIDRDTHARVHAAVATVAVAPLALKGFAAAVPAWSVQYLDQAGG